MWNVFRVGWVLGSPIDWPNHANALAGVDDRFLVFKHDGFQQENKSFCGNGVWWLNLSGSGRRSIGSWRELEVMNDGLEFGIILLDKFKRFHRRNVGGGRVGQVQLTLYVGDYILERHGTLTMLSFRFWRRGSPVGLGLESSCRCILYTSSRFSPLSIESGDSGLRVNIV
jgi:hypothetical protein